MQDKGSIGIDAQTTVEARLLQPLVSLRLQVFEDRFGSLVYIDVGDLLLVGVVAPLFLTLQLL